MAFLLYNLALLAASPLLLVYLLYRVLVLGKSREGLSQRFGFSPRLPPARAGRIWLHAVSAGEMVAAAAIVRHLQKQAPDLDLVVSATTPAGRQQAEKLLPGVTARCYFPFDLLPCVWLAQARTRPTLIASVETEIWPNWLAAARARGVRTAIVNGQFADKGFRRARRALRLYRWALGNVERLLLQTERAAERARLLGAEPSRIRVVGSAKFEQQIAALSPDAATCLRSRLGEDAPILVAGSTHPGEEEQVLDAFRVARQAIPGLRLLLAPRHVGRADEVEHVVHAAGFRPARRSAGPGNPVDVLILDTMGELAGCYAAGRVAFLGGSLAPIGGHDLLQPLLQGCPVLFGPHMHNQRDVADLALEVGAASEVGSPPELASMVVRLATDECAREKQVRAGRALLARHAGAAGEYARELIRMVREAQASA